MNEADAADRTATYYVDRTSTYKTGSSFSDVNTKIYQLTFTADKGIENIYVNGPGLPCKRIERFVVLHPAVPLCRDTGPMCSQRCAA